MSAWSIVWFSLSSVGVGLKTAGNNVVVSALKTGLKGEYSLSL